MGSKLVGKHKRTISDFVALHQNHSLKNRENRKDEAKKKKEIVWSVKLT